MPVCANIPFAQCACAVCTSHIRVTKLSTSKIMQMENNQAIFMATIFKREIHCNAGY